MTGQSMFSIIAAMSTGAAWLLLPSEHIMCSEQLMLCILIIIYVIVIAMFLISAELVRLVLE